MFYWLMKYFVVGPFVMAIFRPWIVGRENVPVEGAVDPREQPPLVQSTRSSCRS